MHPAQRQIKREAGRYNVLDCGRRFGKDVLGEDLISDAAVGGVPAAWFAPTYRMMLDTWRDLTRLLQPVTARLNSQERRLELITGGWVDLWSLDTPDVARGRKYGRVVVNEAAMVPDLGYAWSNVIRPTLADYQGDAFFLSTPKGRNEFWRMYQRGQAKEGGWRAWQFPTAANPFIKPSEVEAMRSELPERIYQQEILADFIEDSAGVFRRVRECATATRQEQPVDGHRYVFGVDWGRSNDYTVITVIDVEQQALVYIDRFNQIDYSVQRGRLKALAERFHPVVILAELNSIGQPIVEQLQRDGLPVRGFTTTLATKMQIVEGLALGFERGQIKILPDETLIGELQAYEQEQLASGVRYSAPEGMHDDCCISLALAWSIGKNMNVSVAWG